jgi:hypothetical protein
MISSKSIGVDRSAIAKGRDPCEAIPIKMLTGAFAMFVEEGKNIEMTPEP